MEELKYCKLCLVTDVKMFSMNTPSILEAYSLLLHIKVCEDYQAYACYECVSLLRKYQEFRTKCLTAQNVLSSIHIDHSKITKEIVQTIDRKLYKLCSKLACHTSMQCTDHCVLPRNCSEVQISLFINDMKSDNESVELQKPKIELEIDANDFQDENDSEMPLESADCIEDDNDYVPKIKKKPKHALNLKRRKIKTITSKGIKQEENSLSDCSDEPLAKRLKTKRKRRENVSKNDSSKKAVHGAVKKKNSPKFDANSFKDYATVVVLTPEDAKKEVLLRKESNNYKVSPHKCGLCYRGYEFKAAFDNHMKKHSPEYGSLECASCHLKFPEKKFLYKHQFSSHKYKFICKICPYVCYYTYQAKAHMNAHKGKKYPCNICGEMFSLTKTLSKHRLKKHHAECVCALCGAVFATLQDMDAHKTVSHRQESDVLLGPKCAECDVQFATETAWKRHLALSSKHTVRNVCEYCGETFSDEKSLKMHAKLHSEKRPNKKYCNICDKWLKNRNEYKIHMTSQHPLSEAAKKIEADEEKKFVCEECGMAFKKKCFLRYHQRTHSSERPYECRQCGRKFRLPGVLYQHENTHTRQRVFQCDVCQKEYNTKNALVRHIKANHLRIRPYNCSYCDKSFLHEYEMKTHIKYVHYKVPWPKRDRTKRTAKEDSNALFKYF